MKTAEDYVKEIHGYDLDDNTTEILAASYRKYAKQVAEQALQDAAENATTVVDKSRYGCKIVVNKQSILNTEIQLP